MKCFFLLLVVAASQAYVARDVREARSIPAPTLIRLTAIDPAGFIVDWTPVQNSDSSDPILGYKVKVWEETKIKQYHYETIDGVKVLVEETVPEKFETNKIPKGEPKEYLTGPDTTTFKMTPIKMDVTYLIRVQAYSKNAEGPPSAPMSIHLMPKTDDRTKDMYTIE